MEEKNETLELLSAVSAATAERRWDGRPPGHLTQNLVENLKVGT